MTSEKSENQNFWTGFTLRTLVAITLFLFSALTAWAILLSFQLLFRLWVYQAGMLIFASLVFLVFVGVFGMWCDATKKRPVLCFLGVVVLILVLCYAALAGMVFMGFSYFSYTEEVSEGHRFVYETGGFPEQHRYRYDYVNWFVKGAQEEIDDIW